ncbi:MAG: substrate-binding domain-containing protein [Anaerolineaceae bacterium]|nr:substrate-binding domain-containing protein [Anaerolineaceae bacterium]
MKKVFTLVSLLMVISMLMAACAPAATPTAAPQPTTPPVVPQPTTPPPAPKPTEPQAVAPTTAPTGLTCKAPVVVGLITDGSGALASYGAMILRSFMIGMEYAAGAPGSIGPVFKLADKENTFKIDNCEIKVIAVDDKSTPDTTATQARELINVQKVNILVGTASSGATATLQGIALENKIPLIVAPAAANDITGVNFNEYTFRVSRNNYQDAMNLCTYLPTQYKTFVQIAPDYAFGRGSAAAFRDSCTVNGGKFVADDIFAPTTTTDFTPYMDSILKSGAESWIVSWAGSGFVAMMQAAKDQGVLEKMKLGSTFIDNVLMPTFFKDAIGTTSGILYHYTAPKNAINDFLVTKDTANYGVPPDLFDGDGMNAALMLVAALKKTNGDVSGAALAKAMEGLEFDGPKGKVTIRPEDHVAIQDMYILKLVNVTDKEFKYYEYVSTTRPEPPCLLPEALKDRCGKLPYGKLAK